MAHVKIFLLHYNSVNICTFAVTFWKTARRCWVVSYHLVFSSPVLSYLSKSPCKHFLIRFRSMLESTCRNQVACVRIPRS